MSEEEKKAIEDQYKKGLVNLGNIIEPLIRQFKNDYSLDIQQLRLVTNYLLLERDFDEEYYSELDRELEKLQKEIEKLKEPKYMYNANTGKITKIENEKGIEKYKEKVKQLEQEIEELKKDKKALVDNYNKVLGSFISKDKIREKIKELSKTQAYKVGLEEYTIKILNELLEE